jgi:hypothetical protein
MGIGLGTNSRHVTKPAGDPLHLALCPPKSFEPSTLRTTTAPAEMYSVGPTSNLDELGAFEHVEGTHAA